MSEKPVTDIEKPSGGSASAPSSASSESREHWLPRTAGILCATGLVLPTALRLPELFMKGEHPWEAAIFVVAVGAPAAAGRLADLIRAFRGTPK